MQTPLANLAAALAAAALAACSSNKYVPAGSAGSGAASDGGGTGGASGRGGATGSGGSAGSAGSTGASGSGGAASGGLRIQGNKIVTPDGKPFHGRGANLHDTRSCNACAYMAPNVAGLQRWSDELIDNW